MQGYPLYLKRTIPLVMRIPLPVHAEDKNCLFLTKPSEYLCTLDTKVWRFMGKKWSLTINRGKKNNKGGQKNNKRIIKMLWLYIQRDSRGVGIFLAEPCKNAVCRFHFIFFSSPYLESAKFTANPTNQGRLKLNVDNSLIIKFHYWTTLSLTIVILRSKRNSLIILNLSEL